MGGLSIKDKFVKLFNRKDGLFLTFLTGASLLLRLYLLDAFTAPTFDEIGYIPERNEMLSTSIIRSTHPPLGMFFVALGGKLWGKSTFGWRFFPVLFGTACIPLTFYICRRLWKSREIALTSATFLAFEPMLFVMSRMALLDIFMSFFILLSAFFFAKNQKLYCAVSLGFALCVKWVSVIVIFGVIFLLFLAFSRNEIKWHQLLSQLVVFITVPIIVYTIVFCILHKNLNFHFFTEFHRYYISQMSTVPTSGYLTSPWWSWLIVPQYLPLGEKLIESAHRTLTVTLKIIEIPALLWMGLLAILSTFVEMLACTWRREKTQAELPLVYFSFLYFPWMLVTRGTYFFYLTPALPFLCIILAYSLNRYLKEGPLFTLKVLFITYTVLSFFILYPHFVGWL